jgi:L-tartrate/succinate antiporter
MGPLNKKGIKIGIPVLVGISVCLLPVPAELSPNAWYFFAIFLSVILGLIFEPLPAAAIGFIGVTLTMIFGLISTSSAESIKWGLSGFSNATVWLIFGAFMLSMGYEKSGLGRRIALVLVKYLGKRTLGLGYAIALADLALAPVTPSNTARSAGTIYPIIRNIPGLFDSQPGPTANKIGSYLMWTAFAITAVTSSLFLTGLAPNFLALSFVQQVANIKISWMEWFLGFLPMGILLLLIIPLMVYWLYPPTIKTAKEVPLWAAEELKKMGPATLKEIIMALLAGLALSLWIFGRQFIHATTVVWIVISLMIVLRIVDWEDILSNHSAWNVLVWFATLVALADGLKQVGFVDWITGSVSDSLSHLSPTLILGGLTVFFFVIHYLFASITAHTIAILPVLLAIGKAIPQINPWHLSLLLCYSLGLMGILTPYATGPAPLYYSCGYISPKDFWKLGIFFGTVYLLVLLIVGIPYLNFIF